MFRSGLSLVFSFLGGLVLLFLLAPLIKIFLDTSNSQLFEAMDDPDVRASIGLTLRISLFATLVLAMGAIPLAWILARQRFPGKNILESLIDLPVVIPHSAAGIALLGFISRDTVVGDAASKIGLNFVGEPLGIAVAMGFVSLPFLIHAARDAFFNVPVRLEKAALSLGASRLQTFWLISLPLAWRGIVSGLIMMFARGLSEFGAVVIIAYHPMVTPVMIWDRFTAFGLSYSRPVAALFILVCLIFFVLLRILATRYQDGRS